MIPTVKETFEKLIDLHIKKNQDYTGKSNNPYFSFDAAQQISTLFIGDNDKVYATMIGIKLARIAALLNSGNTANHESIEDSFDDLIVYAAIWKSTVKRTNY